MNTKLQSLPDVFNKFSSNLTSAMEAAFALARELGQSSVRLEFLVWGVLNRNGSIAGELLTKHGLNAEKVKSWLVRRIIQSIEPQQMSSTTNLPQQLDDESTMVLEKSVMLANHLQHKYVGTEHFLATLIDHIAKTISGPTATLFQEHAVNAALLKSDLQSIIKTTSKFPDIVETMSFLPMGSHAEDDDGVTPALDFFTTELTSQQMEQHLDPVIGREAELDRLIQILMRRTKNNPLLLGDAGVGKTAIVEGLAKRINRGEVPEILLKKKILALDLSVLVAGSMFRGEFEARLKQVLEEVRRNEDTILFIDEIHTMVGAGSASGTLDAANILKPALARGEIRCIGATTFEEYKKYIEKDNALSRRFQTITVDEPTEVESIQILKGLKSQYETYHRIGISDEAITEAVRLSHRYIPDRRLPDKAIDLIDEALSGVRMNLPSEPLERKLRQNETLLDDIRKRKHEAVKESKLDVALDLRSEESLLSAEIDALKARLAKRQGKLKAHLSAEAVARVVHRWTGVPMDHLTTSSPERLNGIETILKEHIIGQTPALEALGEQLWRAVAGFSSPDRPLGSLLFAGPSGVGKTETATVLAKHLFGGGQHPGLIRIDMSEYGEAFTVSKLIGSPAGYVGYRESGMLTDRIRQHPASVVLFDEVEKAHPDVYHLLLQILEDGRLTDGTGRTVSFRQAIIILTTNIGSDTILRPGIEGFGRLSSDGVSYSSDIERNFHASLKKHFRVELLNRIDATVIFHPLDALTRELIVDKELKNLNNRLKQKSWSVTVDPSVRTFLATHQFNSELGARHIRHNIQHWIETPLARAAFTTTAHNDGRFHIILRENVPAIEVQSPTLPTIRPIALLKTSVHRSAIDRVPLST